MKYIGLLTDEQKRAGIFVTQAEDFIYLWRGRNGNPTLRAVFLYVSATVKEIRDEAGGQGKMQAQLIIKCGQCSNQLGVVNVDTADMPEQLQEKVNAVILAHRQYCRYYASTESI